MFVVSFVRRGREVNVKMYRHDTRRSRLLQLSRTCHLSVKLQIRQTRKSRQFRVMAVPAVTSEMPWWLLPREMKIGPYLIKSTFEHQQLGHFLGIEFRSSYSMGWLLCLCERHQRTPHYEAHQVMQAHLHTEILAALDHSHGAVTRTLRPTLAAHDRFPGSCYPSASASSSSSSWASVLAIAHMAEMAAQ